MTIFFWDKKSPQRKSASATITTPVELMIGTTMNSSKNRIKDEHKKRHISET